MDPRILDESNSLARVLTAKSSVYSRIIETHKSSRRASTRSGSVFNIRPTTSGTKQSTMMLNSRPTTADFRVNIEQQSVIQKQKKNVSQTDIPSELEDRKVILFLDIEVYNYFNAFSSLITS